jgi:hypothetical protein
MSNRRKMPGRFFTLHSSIHDRGGACCIAHYARLVHNLLLTSAYRVQAFARFGPGLAHGCRSRGDALYCALQVLR